MSRTQRCGSCQGCTAKPCRMCTYCLDNPQNGGPGVKKQSCVARRCVRVVESKLQREASNHKLRVGCGHCEECLQPDCGACLICMDKRVFRGRYLRDAACAKKKCVQGRSLNGSPQATPSPRPIESPGGVFVARAETSSGLNGHTWARQRNELQNGHQKSMSFSQFQLRKRLLAQSYDEVNKKLRRTVDGSNDDDSTQPYGAYKNQLVAGGMDTEEKINSPNEGSKLTGYHATSLGADSLDFRGQYADSFYGPRPPAALQSPFVSTNALEQFNSVSLPQNGLLPYSVDINNNNNLRKDRTLGSLAPNQCSVLKDRLFTEWSAPPPSHSQYDDQQRVRYQDYSNPLLQTNSPQSFFCSPIDSYHNAAHLSYRGILRQPHGSMPTTAPPAHYGSIVTQPMGPMDQPVVILQQL